MASHSGGLCCRTAKDEHTIHRTEELSDIMTRFCVPPSRLTGALTTPGGTGCTAGMDASCSTMQQQPDAVVGRFDVTREETGE